MLPVAQTDADGYRFHGAASARASLPSRLLYDFLAIRILGATEGMQN